MQVAQDMIQILEMVARRKPSAGAAQRTKSSGAQTDDWRMHNLPTKQAMEKQATKILAKQGGDVTKAQELTTPLPPPPGKEHVAPTVKPEHRGGRKCTEVRWEEYGIVD